MKHEIEIPDLPEGWEAVAYRNPQKGEEYIHLRQIWKAHFNEEYPYIIVRKKRPRRIVLEETDIANAEVAFHDDDGVWKYWKIVEDGK